MTPPSKLYPQLYPALQASAAIVDMKAVADATPRADPAEIERAFASEAPADAAALRGFVARWFDLPVDPASFVPDPHATMVEHIDRLWDHLVRTPVEADGTSLVGLAHAYLVPGGMFRECYYWDSYFTILGLGADRAGLREECVAALAEQIDRFGFVPNGNRTYYLSRSQPPTFYASVATLTPDEPARSWARYLPQLLREHVYWMAAECVVPMPDGALLNRYWDSLATPRDEASSGGDLRTATASGRDAPLVYRDIRAACASGWDFSSRWFGDRADIATIRTTDILPCDLNALLHGLESAIAAGASFAGRDDTARQFADRADARRDAMTRWLWNDATGVFDDYDHLRGELRGALSAAAAVPLFAGCATSAQAAATAQALRGLLAPGGLLATARHTGEQWDAPNGWAPSHWMAVRGLQDAGEHDLARDIARRWLTTVSRVFADSGRMMEKYDLVGERAGGGGEYPLQDGFGWTNGVTVALLDLYPEFAALGAVRYRPG